MKLDLGASTRTARSARPILCTAVHPPLSFLAGYVAPHSWVSRFVPSVEPLDSLSPRPPPCPRRTPQSPPCWRARPRPRGCRATPRLVAGMLGVPGVGGGPPWAAGRTRQPHPGAPALAASWLVSPFLSPPLCPLAPGSALRLTAASRGWGVPLALSAVDSAA